VVRKLIKTGVPLALGVEQRFMTVLFTDLQDFSTLAEQMVPNDLLAQLSAYFEVVSNAIAEESGTVDKFIGDGIMAFWGAPIYRDDHVLRGCCGAMRATRRVEQLNAQWSKQGRPPLHLRIGLHCADVLVGNVGSTERLSYTVMGDGVNVAARLEGINKTFGTTICISDSVVEAVGPNIVARPIRKVQVKGRKREFMIYELLGIKASDDPELKASEHAATLCDRTGEASICFERGELDQAAAIMKIFCGIFLKIQSQNRFLRCVQQKRRSKFERSCKLIGLIVHQVPAPASEYRFYLFNLNHHPQLIARRRPRVPAMQCQRWLESGGPALPLPLSAVSPKADIRAG
jgi:adenylate cyclase